MTTSTPPIETHHFRKSQTPESPRPVHAPQPSNIPVLNNQMDPIFNDTATYNIPNNQTLSPYSDPHREPHESSTEEHDAVQSFFRGAEAESSLSQALTQAQQQTENDAAATHLADSLSFSMRTTQPDHQAHDTVKAEQDLSRGPTTLATQTTAQQSDDTSFLPSLPSQSNSNEPSALREPTQEAGVDYQSLLDTIAQSASTAPAVDALTAPTTVAAGQDQSTASLNTVPGLPAKPPTQNASLGVSNLGFTQPTDSFAVMNALPQHPIEQPNPISTNVDQNQAAGAALDPSANGIGPVSGLYHTPTEISYPPTINTAQANADRASAPDSAPGERPWSPRTQGIYDQFLEDERRYVTEGIWDRFQYGSRLFVGNLPSEKVTKRDLFHIFHRYGQLAQVSIKQAYGFVQFLEAAACADALRAEQGVEIRGRKVHLEVSKPQKNTRRADTGGTTKSAPRRRSRSPDRSRSSNERLGIRPPFSEYRDEMVRSREEYRRRSPSPTRAYRSRDDYRGTAQSPRGYQFPDPRPRSPAAQGWPSPGIYPPPPVPQGIDEDAALQIPRRDPRDVPDVQILVLDPSVASSFINWVEQTFRSKGLRASTIWLNQRLPMQAVVKRQILEGVQAIVKLIQHNQFNQKVPLQVFDRSAGASNVNFNEYVDLDISTAADIVLHARSRERSQSQQSPHTPYSAGQSFQHAMPQAHQAIPPPLQNFPPPPIHTQRPPHQQYPYPPQPHHLTPAPPAAGTPNLQQLLANLRQPQGSQPPPPPPPLPQGRADIGGLLSNIAAHRQNQDRAQPQSSPPIPQPYPNQPSQQGYGGGQNQNVQNIMEQLARYGR